MSRPLARQLTISRVGRGYKILSASEFYGPSAREVLYIKRPPRTSQLSIANDLGDLVNMAPSATNGDAIAVLEDIKAPPGVVLPPKEIKGTSRNLFGSRSANASHSDPREDSRLRSAEWDSIRRFVATPSLAEDRD
jgi:hypothetical protein